MLESISGFLSALRQATPPILIGIAVAAALLLFMNEEYVTKFGLQEFRDKNRSYIGAALIGSVSILASQLVWWLRLHIWIWFQGKQSQRQREKWLHALTPDEKAYLLPYIANSENTQYFAIEDGVAQGLKEKGIIYMASTVGSILDGFAYNLQPWAREALENDPELLEGAGSQPLTPRQRRGLW